MHICNYITAAKLVHAQFCAIKFHSTHKSSFLYIISNICCGVFYKSYIGSTFPLILHISGQVPKCRLRASVFESPEGKSSVCENMKSKSQLTSLINQYHHLDFTHPLYRQLSCVAASWIAFDLLSISILHFKNKFSSTHMYFNWILFPCNGSNFKRINQNQVQALYQIKLWIVYVFMSILYFPGYKNRTYITKVNFNTCFKIYSLTSIQT